MRPIQHEMEYRAIAAVSGCAVKTECNLVTVFMENIAYNKNTNTGYVSKGTDIAES